MKLKDYIKVNILEPIRSLILQHEDKLDEFLKKKPKIMEVIGMVDKEKVMEQAKKPVSDDDVNTFVTKLNNPLIIFPILRSPIRNGIYQKYEVPKELTDELEKINACVVHVLKRLEYITEEDVKSCGS